MNKSIKIVMVILVITVVVCGLAVWIYSKQELKNEIGKKEYTYNFNEQKELGKIVRVNGKMYYDTKKESTITLRCGTLDGRIETNIESNKIPTKDNQANFEGNYGYQFTNENEIELNIDGKWIVFEERTFVTTNLTLEDEIGENAIWCGTFQLIWNDLKNDLAKQDIVFTPQLKVVENLNKQTFTTNDISNKCYYKKYGTPTLELKKEIETEIKNKFNEKSDILDEFEWVVKDPKDYFLYVMLKKEFKFEKSFDELDNGKFKNYDNVRYFGIKKDNENDELKKQVEVLYYNTKEDFAIKLKTKKEDEIILCKNPKGNTFNEIYKNVGEQQKNYKGKTYIQNGELLKIPNLKINEKTEFVELEKKPFLFSNGDEYKIEKALQTIQFELDKTGGKIKSEAGMMVRKESAIIVNEIREFALDDTFAIFLIEEGKSTPYFAGKVSDITKFQ